jgi:hemin uptake protein HemP
MENTQPPAHRGKDGSEEPARATPRILSRDLFKDGRRIIIEHQGKEYSLIITRQGKLVLNRC